MQGGNRDADIENGLADTGREGKGSDERRRQHWCIHTTQVKWTRQWKLLRHRELSSVLCDGLGVELGEEGGGRGSRESVRVYTRLIRAGVEQKLPQHCKQVCSS